VSNTPIHRGTGPENRALGRTDARAGDGLVRAGAVVFFIGALATLVTVAPLFLGMEPLPTAAYLVSMLMGVGFAIAGTGVLRGIAEQRRQARGPGTARPAR
jgi:cation transporter-like permease